jgi:hypothetical protein
MPSEVVKKTLKRTSRANFYEKAPFVKPTWRPRCVVYATTLPFARYASIRTVSVSPLFGDSVHYEIRLDSGSTKALQSS